MIQVEFLKIRALLPLLPGVDVFGNQEQNIQHDGEGDAVHGGDLF